MKKFAIIAALAAFGFGAQAQIFYKVEKEGGKPSYILGTHHFAPLSTIDSIAELPGALKEVDALYGEIDMSDMQNPAKIMEYQSMMVAPKDSTIDKLLTKAQIADLEKLWEYYMPSGMPLQVFYGMKPSIVTTTLSAAMSQSALRETVQTPDQGIDMTMQTRATELGKPVVGLETMAFQFDMLYNQPISKQISDLVELVTDSKSVGEKAVTLTTAYLNHDLDTVLKLMEEETEDSESMDRMIYSRNATWLTELGEILPAKSIMLVVGAGHLPGDKGVLEGLRKAGYTITAIQ